MPENGFYLPRYFPYKVRILILENMGQSFVLAHSTAKKKSAMNN